MTWQLARPIVNGTYGTMIFNFKSDDTIQTTIAAHARARDSALP
ncbi:MAG TPA: hypothetical protein VH143_24050 [Kofleriaceae bacterium]|nr:hypothetical protein [Kofleriaceae bacterium]